MTERFRSFSGRMSVSYREFLNGKFTAPALLLSASVASSAVFYLPYFAHFSVIFRYWDGPNYAWVAKSLYQSPVDHPLASYGTTPAYFACHLPFYPVLIRLFSFIGYMPAMILVTLLSSLAASLAYYHFLKDTKLVASPFYTAVFFLFIPPRYLIYRHVGATEPLFIFFLITSMHAFYREKFTLSFVLASLSAITRITGVLMLPVYFILILKNRRWSDLFKLPIIAFPLFLTFLFYRYQFGDFWAYFSWNSGLMHLMPADVMRAFANSEDGRSAEYFLLLYVLYGLAALLMRKHSLPLFVFGCVFFLFSLFIFHGDLSRYLIPLAPFTLLIAFDPVLRTREFRTIFFALIIPLSYVYSFGQLEQNLVVEWVYTKLMFALQK